MNLGKKVKVRDMKPGWTYRVPGKTLEEIYESAHEYAKWPPVQMTDVQIMLKRNASSATAELLFHF